MRVSRKRWWATGLVVAWAAVLLVAASWSAHRDPATVRGQSDLGAGRQTLDRAVAAVVDAAGPGAAVELEPYQRTPGCRISLSRQGTELDRTVVLTMPAGQEPAALDRLVAGLPDAWQARYHRASSTFRADAGDFVAVRGEVVEPGRVEVTAGTGCRPSS